MNKITISLQVNPKKCVEFLQLMQSFNLDLTREKGFKKATLSRDVADSNKFHLIEEWKTQDDFERHLKSERFRVLTGAVKMLCIDSEIRYRIAEAEQDKPNLLDILETVGE